MLELLRRDRHFWYKDNDVVRIFELADDVVGRNQQLVRFCAPLIVHLIEVDGHLAGGLYYVLG